MTWLLLIPAAYLAAILLALVGLIIADLRSRPGAIIGERVFRAPWPRTHFTFWFPWREHPCTYWMDKEWVTGAEIVDRLKDRAHETRHHPQWERWRWSFFPRYVNPWPAFRRRVEFPAIAEGLKALWRHYDAMPGNAMTRQQIVDHIVEGESGFPGGHWMFLGREAYQKRLLAHLGPEWDGSVAETGGAP